MRRTGRGRRRLVALLYGLLAALSAMGCGGDGQRRFLSLGTAPPGGAFFVVGGAVAGATAYPTNVRSNDLIEPFLRRGEDSLPCVLVSRRRMRKRTIVLLWAFLACFPGSASAQEEGSLPATFTSDRPERHEHFALRGELVYLVPHVQPASGIRHPHVVFVIDENSMGHGDQTRTKTRLE